MDFKSLSSILICVIVIFVMIFVCYYRESIVPMRKRANKTSYYNELSNKQSVEIIELKKRIEELEEKISATKTPGGLPPDEIKDMKIKVLDQQNRKLKSENDLLYSLLNSETKQKYDLVKY